MSNVTLIYNLKKKCPKIQKMASSFSCSFSFQLLTWTNVNVKKSKEKEKANTKAHVPKFAGPNPIPTCH